MPLVIDFIDDEFRQSVAYAVSFIAIEASFAPFGSLLASEGPSRDKNIVAKLIKRAILLYLDT